MHVFRYSLSSFRCWCIFSGDMENQVEQEEKSRLINQVLELQHTLEGIKALFFLNASSPSSFLSLFCFVTQHTPFMLLFFPITRLN